MKKVTDFIVNHCYFIFSVFLVVTVICGILSTKVKINKDIYSYMPADSETSLGLEIMNDEFDYDSTSSYEMMLTDVPVEEKFEIKNYIESLEGIKSVDYDDTDNYNRDAYTRYKITINAPADSEITAHLYETIHEKYSEKYELTEAGQVHNYNGKVIDITTILFAIGCAMVILIIMSKSWIEPWLFLFAILLAVVVNKGTNIIFPSVSSITDSISAILQMALSMDYAIMLSTRYRQEKAKPDCPDKMTAMRHAMRYSFGAISSSSVTTVVGLIVLIFMSFTIGRDMGLVLSKGVVLSLVSIFTSLPALLLLFDKAIEKTKKKALSPKMDWFGKQSFNLRHIAFPVFLFIFIGSFLLKGNTVINYTSDQNNKIKDIFKETNQIALVYDAKLDQDVTNLCHDYENRKDTTQVLCYGNTIGEPEKYQELIPKINELGDEPVKTEDYLVKAIYYHYYKDVDSHTMSLNEFVEFLQNEVFPSDRFTSEVTNEIKSKIGRFSYFVNQTKVNQPRTKNEIANILGVDASKLDDVLVLYLSKQNVQTNLTLNEFANFVSNEILTNPNYSSMVSASQRSDLSKLKTLSNSNITNTPKSSAELAQIFDIDQNSIEQILTYYIFTNINNPSVSASAETLINFALSNQTITDELGLSDSEVTEIETNLANLKDLIEEVKSEITPFLEEHNINLENITSFLTKEYSFDDINSVANNIKSILDYLKIEDDFGLNDALSKLKDIYRLYQAETTASSTTISPRDFVGFLLNHSTDDKLKDALSPETLAKLSLAKDIMDSQSTKYSASALSTKFNLDRTKINLVYTLYYYRHIDNNPLISLKTVINFINDEILPNPEYANRLDENEQLQLRTIADLMHSAEAGAQYNYDSLYRAVLPLAGNLDKNQLFLAYLYHGSLYDYDETWRLTIENFVEFLTAKVLPDSRFEKRLDSEMREKILDGQKTVSNAKELLVSTKHYRALIESDLPAEGEATFAFIKELKERLGPTNKTDYFLIGDSAMAYEMSETFNDEMNFITILTMLSIFVVVVFTFKSLFVSLLLVLVIQCAVYIVMAYLSLTGSSIYFIALIIVQAILMGATIDYAILFTSYYIENRTYFKLDVKNALIDTYNKSIGAILTSASILIIVTAIVGNFASAIAATICSSISLGTLCATIIILVLLPALLATLDKFIIKK
ncbi:MMPL family transporter [Candidatus Saccharibacteria bacterium]|nr:MMPL family transporter [Candidatus Saccharibacteria bacterium]